MKKLFFVFGLILALLFAPVVFGAELAHIAPGLGFDIQILNGDRPEIVVFDFAGSCQNSADIILIKTRNIQPFSVIYESAGTNADRFNSGFNFQGAGNREGVGKYYFDFATEAKETGFL